MLRIRALTRPAVWRVSAVRAYSDKPAEDPWDFLNDPEEPEGFDSDNLEDMDFKTELHDLYAKPANRTNPESHNFLKKEKVSFVAKSHDDPSTVSGNDLADVFRPRRRMADSASGTAGVTATHKEKEIFSQIFDTILSRSVADGGRSAQGNKPGMTSNMQALFESTLGGTQSQKKEDVQMSMTTEDVRKYPLSMASLMVSKGNSPDDTKPQGQKYQTVLQNKLQPVLDYINSFETDHEVSQYYREKIIKVYKERQEQPDKEKQSEPVYNTVESLEAWEIDPESPPVNSKALPIILLACVRTLANDFAAPEQAAMLFELSKQQGIDFYVAACSSSVYNEVLRCKWNAYKDLYLVESLISEMDINGLKADSDTSEILSSVARYCIELKRGSLEADQVPLWSEEDEERLSNLNRYRLRILEQMVQRDNVRQGQLLSQLIKM